jgi:hypothetical protein
VDIACSPYFGYGSVTQVSDTRKLDSFDDILCDHAMSVLLPASAAKTVAATLRRALEGASLRLVTLTLSVGCGAAAHAAASIPTEGLQALATSGSVNVLVEYEASAVDTEAAGLPQGRAL